MTLEIIGEKYHVLVVTDFFWQHSRKISGYQEIIYTKMKITHKCLFLTHTRSNLTIPLSSDSEIQIFSMYGSTSI
jgi:hypothetical protein